MHSSLAHPARLCRPGSAPAGTPWPVCPPSFKIRAVQNVPLLHAGTRLTRRASLPPPPPPAAGDGAAAHPRQAAPLDQAALHPGAGQQRLHALTRPPQQAQHARLCLPGPATPSSQQPHGSVLQWLRQAHRSLRCQPCGSACFEGGCAAPRPPLKGRACPHRESAPPCCRMPSSPPATIPSPLPHVSQPGSCTLPSCSGVINDCTPNGDPGLAMAATAKARNEARAGEQPGSGRSPGPWRQAYNWRASSSVA